MKLAELLPLITEQTMILYFLVYIWAIVMTISYGW